MSLTKQLIVMRHAKSDWQADFDKDFDRPLNERGLEAAAGMGKFFYEQQIRPDLLIHSAAKRTSQTAEVVCQSASWSNLDVLASHNLYHCTVQQMLAVIKSIDTEVGCLMLVGHEPTCSQLLHRLSNQWQSYPTAAVAIYSLPIEDWHDVLELSPAPQWLSDFIIPKQLQHRLQASNHR